MPPCRCRCVFHPCLPLASEIDPAKGIVSARTKSNEPRRQEYSDANAPGKASGLAKAKAKAKATARGQRTKLLRDNAGRRRHPARPACPLCDYLPPKTSHPFSQRSSYLHFSTRNPSYSIQLGFTNDHYFMFIS